MGKCDKVCDRVSLFREGDERVGKCDKVCDRNIGFVHALHPQSVQKKSRYTLANDTQGFEKVKIQIIIVHHDSDVNVLHQSSCKAGESKEGIIKRFL